MIVIDILFICVTSLFVFINCPQTEQGKSHFLLCKITKQNKTNFSLPLQVFHIFQLMSHGLKKNHVFSIHLNKAVHVWRLCSLGVQCPKYLPNQIKHTPNHFNMCLLPCTRQHNCIFSSVRCVVHCGFISSIPMFIAM